MNSIGDNCTELKKKYDTCFNQWFSERFLKGEKDDSMCSPLFKVYQQCVKDAMKAQKIEFKEIESDVLGTDREQKVPPKAAGGSSSS
ncbi:TP53-regulated inhibitor of apoptosis 1-like [Topomyia yanbarensis]|uniref:TP53-regulated inhibitor of apoptosis 1-like n=1 Tax=Topomyia yanbarensis TaxID=2498891 RepID=UPI00273C99B6|nr:TP53-regulated inhibitor of apoptosis 1-like [Topomyia yanbarensis]